MNRWDWLSREMPRVPGVVADLRREYGAQWVQQCWQAGVVQGQAGHFWAAQGVVQLGVPWDADLVQDWLQLRAKTPDVAMVVIADPKGEVTRHVHVRGGEHGA